MTMQTVTLRINPKKRTKYAPEFNAIACCAESCGLLAVHRTIGNPSRWTVTHKATGLAFAKAVPTRAAARRLAKELIGRLGALGIDLRTTDRAWPQHMLTYDQRQQIAALIRSVED